MTRFLSLHSLHVAAVAWLAVITTADIGAAATASATFNVQITITAECKISATNLNFGSKTSGTTGNIDAASAIGIQCSNGSGYKIGLDPGKATGATVTTRAMTITGGGSDVISYSISTDSARTKNWGSTDPDTVSGTGNGVVQSIPVYGRVVLPTTMPKVGDYADIITATVTY